MTWDGDALGAAANGNGGETSNDNAASPREGGTPEVHRPKFSQRAAASEQAHTAGGPQPQPPRAFSKRLPVRSSAVPVANGPRPAGMRLGPQLKPVLASAFCMNGDGVAQEAPGCADEQPVGFSKLGD
jgi:hypothetical protein